MYEKEYREQYGLLMSFIFYSKVNFVGSLTSTVVYIYVILLITLCLVRNMYMVVYKI